MTVETNANSYFTVDVHTWDGEDHLVGSVKFKNYSRAKSFAFHWSKQVKRNFSRIFIGALHERSFIRSYRDGFIVSDVLYIFESDHIEKQ